MKRSNRIIIMACIAMVLGGVLAGGYVYKQRTLHPTAVTAGVLYRSALPTKRQLSHLGDLNIRTVVSLCAPDQPLDKENAKACRAEKQFCQEHGLEFVDIPVTALVPTDEQVKQFLGVMAKHRGGVGGAVLVHCAQGRNRTGMMVAAYRIVIEDRPGEKALKEMQDMGADRDGDKGAKKAAWLMGISKDRETWRATSRRTTTTAPDGKADIELLKSIQRHY